MRSGPGQKRICQSLSCALLAAAGGAAAGAGAVAAWRVGHPGQLLQLRQNLGGSGGLRRRPPAASSSMALI